MQTLVYLVLKKLDSLHFIKQKPDNKKKESQLCFNQEHMNNKDESRYRRETKKNYFNIYLIRSFLCLSMCEYVLEIK